MIIYQVLPRLYGNSCQTRKPNGTLEENGCGKLNGFTPSVLKQIRELGATHVWYTGVIRHATTTDYSAYGLPSQHPAVVKGRAGSPYAITDYYDIDPDLAVDVRHRMDEFTRLVARTHRAGLKVIIDFVPNHVARQYHSIAKPEDVHDLGEDDDPTVGFDPVRNNFYYCPGQAFTPYFDLYHGAKEPYYEMPAKATGNDHFDNAPGRNDWYETVKLNYGVDYYAGQTPASIQVSDQLTQGSTWQKMRDILLFWADKGVDGFRCDMAEMVPAAFWAWVTAQVKALHPGILFIGEVYNPGLYRTYIASGFDYLYDKVGMYDALCNVLCHRTDIASITQAWQQTDDIGSHMLYFMENHDELRLASDFLVGNGERALPAVIVSALLRQNPFMLYAGQEWGEHGMDVEGFSGHDGRTTIFDYWSFLPHDAAAEALTQIYRTLLNIARSEKAITEGKFFDLMYVNRHLSHQYAFMRCASQRDLLLVVANFDDIPAAFELTIPDHAFEYLGIAKGDYDATDLLTGQHLGMFEGHIALPPRGSLVLRLELKRRNAR
ncbi:MAG: alpha-amylase family protein [Prevotella sp.]|nr:alpha-amylase family protein [Prevotella sp.]